jgi:hypothetical protein
MTHYKLYSLHLGCGEPLATQYQPAQVSAVEKKRMGKKRVQVKTSQVTGRKRK